MDDLISRQAVLSLPIYNEKNLYGNIIREYVDIEDVKQLPSAQPEIVQCRKCKFASGDSRICMKFGHSPIGELDFCAWAELPEPYKGVTE